MNKELLKKVKTCKSRSELESLLKENNINVNNEKLDIYYNRLINNELSEEELVNVGGGTSYGIKESGSTPLFKIGDIFYRDSIGKRSTFIVYEVSERKDIGCISSYYTFQYKMKDEFNKPYGASYDEQEIIINLERGERYRD